MGSIISLKCLYVGTNSRNMFENLWIENKYLRFQSNYQDGLILFKKKQGAISYED